MYIDPVVIGFAVAFGGIMILANRMMAAEARAYRDDCLDAQRKLADERRANRRPWYVGQSRVEAN
jgi:hypothetical protein